MKKIKFIRIRDCGNCVYVDAFNRGAFPYDICNYCENGGFFEILTWKR